MINNFSQYALNASDLSELSGGVTYKQAVTILSIVNNVNLKPSTRQRVINFVTQNPPPGYRVEQAYGLANPDGIIRYTLIPDGAAQ